MFDLPRRTYVVGDTKQSGIECRVCVLVACFYSPQPLDYLHVKSVCVCVSVSSAHTCMHVRHNGGHLRGSLLHMGRPTGIQINPLYNCNS